MSLRIEKLNPGKQDFEIIEEFAPLIRVTLSNGKQFTVDEKEGCLRIHTAMNQLNITPTSGNTILIDRREL